jgi:hypothetical protein
MLCSTEVLLKENPNLDKMIREGGGAYAMSCDGCIKYSLKRSYLLSLLTERSI